MPTEKEMKAVKKLTQAQKAYLVKRIDSIVSIKKQKINENSPPCPNGMYHNGCLQHRDDSIHEETFHAIIDGKVKLNPPNFLSVNDFINASSLKKFNRSLNKRNIEMKKDRDKRYKALNKEAEMIKDKIILEGSAATELLEKFETTDF